MKKNHRNLKPFFIILFGWIILYPCFFLHCERAMEPPTVYEGQQAYLAYATETPSFVFLTIGFRRDKTIGLSDKSVYVRFPPNFKEEMKLINNLSSDDNHDFIVIKFIKEDLKQNQNKASFSLILSPSQNKWVDIDSDHSDIWHPGENIGIVYFDFTRLLVYNYQNKVVAYMSVKETDDIFNQ